jgi:hypothetical protein
VYPIARGFGVAVVLAGVACVALAR